MFKQLLAAGAIWLAAVMGVSAQSVTQSGSVTPGHLVVWTTNGVVSDAGTAASPSATRPITSIGVRASGPGICQYSDAQTAAGYQRICLSVTTASGGAITIDSFGTATPQPFALIVNGVTASLATVTPPFVTNDLACFQNTSGVIYDCGFGTGSAVLGPGSSTVGDIAVWNNLTGTLLKDVPALQIFGTQTANTGLFGPASGGAAFPTFRALVVADLPATAVIGPGSSTAGHIATWNNTTGSLLADTAPLAIFGTQTANTFLAGPTSGGATNPAFRALVAADLPAGVVACTTLGAFPVGTGSAAQCSTIFGSVATLNGAPLTINASGFALQPTVAGQTSAMRLSGGQDSVNQGETILEFDTYGANAQGTILLSKSGGGVLATGSVSGTVLTITAVQFGSLAVGQIVGVLPGTIPVGTTIVSLGTGTGGIGTYNLSASGTASPGSTVRTNDSPTSPTAVINQEFLGVIESAGWYVSAGTPTRTNMTAMINFLSDGGNFSATSWPTSIQFLTTPANSITPGNPTTPGDILNPNQQFVISSNGSALEQINNIATTITDGIVVRNVTPATAGVPVQQSPSVRLTGFGWKTNATAASQEVDGIITLVPAQGTAAPTGTIAFGMQVNGAGYTNEASISSGGVFNVLTGYQIGGAATSGHVLKGNGTNYIDGQVAFSELTGSAACSQLPAFTGDVTTSAGTCATTLATVASAGTTGSSTAIPVITINAKGLTTSITTAAVIAPAGTLTGTTLASNVVTSSLTSLGTITSLTATTINAFTLGGTIAGGGNQINNVIIGTSTPLAGSFTTLSASTSVSSPIHAAAGVLTFQSNGSTAAGYIDTSQRWVIGPNTVTLPTGPSMFITKNTGTIPSVAVGSALVLASADGVPTRLQILAAGTGVNSSIHYYTSNGTLASPTATQSGDFLGCNFWFGYGTSYQTNGGGGFCSVAAQTYTGSVGGTQLQIFTTPSGAVIQVLAATFQASGGFSIGTATDPGTGGLQVNGNIFAPNLPTTTGALGAAVCWTATTGQFQRDTNAGGCLVSSRTVKHDIAPLTGSLDAVTRMRPVSFVYNDESVYHGQQQGFIAEEMATVDRTLVGFGADGSPQMVKYLEISARLVGAIQELKADNDNLRKQIDKLSYKVFRLRR